MKVILFSGENCGVCQALKPKLSELLDEYNQVSFEVVNVERNPKKAADYSVFTLPVAVVEMEGKEYGRFVGSFSLIEVETMLNRLISLFES